MTPTNSQGTVVGVFEDRGHADKAVRELREAGFTESEIGVAGRFEDGKTHGTTTDEGSNVGTGAVAGVLAGAGLGGLVGLGVVAGLIPVIGPVIAGGTLAAILANAAGGAVMAGIAGALIGAGIPEDEAKYYHSEFEAGRTIVTVKAGGRFDEALAILRRSGGYDMSTRPARSADRTASTGSAATAAPKGKGGTTTSATKSSGSGRSKPSSRATESEGDVLELREEELRAQTRPVETGEVLVRKEVHTEHQTLDVPVRREEVVIERHAPGGGKGATRGKVGDSQELRIPVMEEEVVVEKRAVVKEEVTVGKRAVQETKKVVGDVRKETLKVEREGDVEVHGGSSSGKKTPRKS